MLHNSFEKKDVEMARALKSVLSQAQFPIKGDAILKVAAIVQWLDNLPLKIEQSIVPPSTIRKDLKGK